MKYLKNLFFLFLICSSSSLNAQQHGHIDVQIVSMVERLFAENKGGVFRGIDFNMSLNEALEVEKNTELFILDDEEGNFFGVSVDFKNAVAIEFADIVYDFDAAGLYYITVEAYLASKETSEKMCNVIKTRMTKAYGKGILAEDGFLVWDAYDEKSGYNYQLAILDFSTVDEPGFYFEIYALEAEGATD